MDEPLMTWEVPNSWAPDGSVTSWAQWGFTIDDRKVLLQFKSDGKWQSTKYWTRAACEKLPAFFLAHNSTDQVGTYLEIEN